MKTTYSNNWRKKLHDMIYEADTRLGKWFDIILLILIVTSIIIVMLESVEYYNTKYHTFFNYAEWTITILFTLEYFARIISIKNPKSYIFSFYGIIDLLSTIPKYLSYILVGAHALVALRALRLLRIFRVLKLARFIGESENLVKALKASRAKISVFLLAVLSISVILGTFMYLIETNQDSGFDSIPRSVYWAIVTLTTVGYGDIAPITPFGQLIASIIMILGYAIIAIPTGIVSVEFSKRNKVETNTQSCPHCLAINHHDDAEFCYECGEKLN